MELSVVIPVYHTARNAVQHLPDVIPALREKFNDFEIIFIIDNEDILPDVKCLFAVQDEYREIKIRKLHKNFGQHFATLSGYYVAQGTHILSVDQDMTQYLTAICGNEDYKNHDVYFFHYDKSTMYNSVVRRLCSILFKAMIHRIINFKRNSTFRIITPVLRDKILLDRHIFWNIDVMIFNNTDSIGGCNFEIANLKDDNSSYNYKTLINVAFEIVYEHNNILTNLLFALIPALIVQFIYGSAWLAAGTYVAFAAFITLVFVGIKMMTPSTEKKISYALREKLEQHLLEPVPE